MFLFRYLSVISYPGSWGFPEGSHLGMANSAIRAPQPAVGQSLPRGDGYLWIALGLIIANLAVYWRLAGCQFLNFDDDWYVVNNSSVSGGLPSDTVGVSASL